MTSQRWIPSQAEADPLWDVQFRVEPEPNVTNTLTVECQANYKISALKKEKEGDFDIMAENQVWFYEDVQLRDNITLMTFMGADNNSAKEIIVKNSQFL